MVSYLFLQKYSELPSLNLFLWPSSFSSEQTGAVFSSVLLSYFHFSDLYLFDLFKLKVVSKY